MSHHLTIERRSVTFKWLNKTTDVKDIEHCHNEHNETHLLTGPSLQDNFSYILLQF